MSWVGAGAVDSVGSAAATPSPRSSPSSLRNLNLPRQHDTRVVSQDGGGAARGGAGVVAEVHTAWLVDPVQLAGEGAEDDDEEISLLEMLATDPVAESALGDKPVQALAATSDSLVAATRTTVSVWALEDGGVFARPARLSTGFRYPVTALAASSECIYAGCADGKVHVLQRAEG